MILKSGECRLGVIGTPTQLIDEDGEKLFVGDLVLLILMDDYDKTRNTIKRQFGFEFICEEVGDGGTELGQFVMGVASCFNTYGGSVITHDDKWAISKVKDYQDVVNGEKWGVVRVVDE